MKQISGFTLGIEDTTVASETTATAWSNFEDLTVDKALWQLLHWRSTIDIMMDVSLTGDSKQAYDALIAGLSLWDQLMSIGSQILAKPIVDQWGRLFVEVDTQLLPSADRSSIPEVMTITTNDWGDSLDFGRQPTKRVSMVDMSGISYDGSITYLVSKAQGIVFTLYGQPISIQSLLLSSQSQLNELSGNYIAWQNKTYPNIDVRLKQNNKFIGIGPRQYCKISVTASDTPRGIALTDQNIICRRVEYEWDANRGVMQTYCEFEIETIGFSGQTVVYNPPDNINTLQIVEPFDVGFSIPALFPTNTVTFPEYVPEDDDQYIDETESCPTNADANGPFPISLWGQITDNANYFATARVKTYMRTAGHSNRTYISIYGDWEKFDGSIWEDTSDVGWYNIYILDESNNQLAEGTPKSVSADGKTREFWIDTDSGDVEKMYYLVVALDTNLVDFSGVTVDRSTSSGKSTYDPGSGIFSHYQVGAAYYMEDVGAHWTGTFGSYFQATYKTAFNTNQNLLGETYNISYAVQVLTANAYIDQLSARSGFGISITTFEEVSYSPKVDSANIEGTVEHTFPLGQANPATIFGGTRYNSHPTSTTLDLYIYTYYTLSRAPEYRLFIKEVNFYNVCKGDA
jgi:hypothetical protein